MTNTMAALVVSIVLKGTMALLVTLVVVHCLRGASAAARNLLWNATLGILLLLPLLTVSMPPWSVRWNPHGVPSWPSRPAIAGAGSQPSLVPETSVSNYPKLQLEQVTTGRNHTDSLVSTGVGFPVRISPVQRVSSYPYDLVALVLTVWMFGALIALSHLVVGVVRVRQARRRTRHVGTVASEAMALARQQLGFHRNVDLVCATSESEILVPITFGWIRPTVVVPAQSTTWSAECLRAVFLHELSHIQRGDWPMHVMGRLACALYWFHPLVWVAAHRAREESERACDDCALRAGVQPADYAQRLVDVVRSLPPVRLAGTIGIAMAESTEVESRLQAILARGKRRGSVCGFDRPWRCLLRWYTFGIRPDFRTLLRFR